MNTKKFRKGQKVLIDNKGGYYAGCEGTIIKVGTMIRVQFPFEAPGITWNFGRNTLKIVNRKKSK